MRYSSRSRAAPSSVPATTACCTARISPPAQKARSPSPRIATQRMAPSSAHSANRALIALIMPWVRAFSAWGRSKVKRPSAPRFSLFIWGSMAQTCVDRLELARHLDEHLPRPSDAPPAPPRLDPPPGRRDYAVAGRFHLAGVRDRRREQARSRRLHAWGRAAIG